MLVPGEAKLFNQAISDADMEQENGWFVVNNKFASARFKALNGDFQFSIGDKIKPIEDHLVDAEQTTKIRFYSRPFEKFFVKSTKK